MAARALSVFRDAPNGPPNGGDGGRDRGVLLRNRGRVSRLPQNGTAEVLRRRHLPEQRQQHPSPISRTAEDELPNRQGANVSRSGIGTPRRCLLHIGFKYRIARLPNVKRATGGTTPELGIPGRRKNRQKVGARLYSFQRARPMPGITGGVLADLPLPRGGRPGRHRSTGPVPFRRVACGAPDE